MLSFGAVNKLFVIGFEAIQLKGTANCLNMILKFSGYPALTPQRLIGYTIYTNQW